MTHRQTDVHTDQQTNGHVPIQVGGHVGKDVGGQAVRQQTCRSISKQAASQTDKLSVNSPDRQDQQHSQDQSRGLAAAAVCLHGEPGLTSCQLSQPAPSSQASMKMLHHCKQGMPSFYSNVNLGMMF